MSFMNTEAQSTTLVTCRMIEHSHISCWGRQTKRGANSSILGQRIRKYFDRPADGHSEQFLRLADKEIGGLAKQTTVHRYVCNLLSRPNADPEAQHRAIDCLKRLIDEKLADHNSYYNLAVIYARAGNCKDAIENLTIASKEDKHHAITRKFITEVDQDEFKKIAADKECHEDWERVLNLFS